MSERARPCVLVVENDEANRRAIGRLLRSSGFDTSEASTGREALGLAGGGPDVIVLDLILPDMDGFDVVRRLRSDPRTARIPILQVFAPRASNGGSNAGLENLPDGPNAYLTQPIEPPVLVATIRSLLHYRRLEAAQQAASRDWQAAFDAISDAVCVVDAAGVITRANAAAVSMLALPSSDDILGADWVGAMTRVFPDLPRHTLREVSEATESAVREVRSEARWLRLAGHPLPVPGQDERSTVCVVSDITDRMRADSERGALLEAAERARAEAETANRAKSEFLAMMSHEVRTPINAILGYAQILDMGLAGAISADQRRQLDRLRRSTAHLLQLVNEILDLASVEAGGMRVEREPAAVDEVVEDALSIGRPMALARGIRVDAGTCFGRRVYYVGDSGRVRQILVNLLSNAIKFSTAGGRVDIACEAAPGPPASATDPTQPFVAIHVRDAGVGVSAEQLSVIFEPFVQAETGTTRTWGGSGLGLTISRRLARLMGGDITVSSEPGRGSSFTLWIPASEDQAGVPTAEQPAAPARRGPFDPATLAQIGRVVAGDALAAAHAVALRLRIDPRFAPAAMLSDPQLIDHLPSFIMDLGLALVIVAEVGMEASALLHDGGAIRTEIAERHGAQRRRLGWTADQVDAEYDVLLEELDRLIRARFGGGVGDGQPGDADADAQAAGASELIARLVEQSRAASARGFKEAVGAED